MRPALILGALALSPAIAASQSIPRPLGSEVVVELRSGPSERGELIAVTPDSLWILADLTLTAISNDSVRRVKVDRGVLGSKMNWTWSLVAGGVSGLALSAACSSIDESGCGAVFVASVVSWLLYGAISASSMANARYETISNWRHLTPHARFPAGMPAGVDAARLVGTATPD